MDNLTKKGAPDRSKINMHEDYEVKYWTKDSACRRKSFGRPSTKLVIRRRPRPQGIVGLINVAASGTITRSSTAESCVVEASFIGPLRLPLSPVKPIRLISASFSSRRAFPRPTSRPATTEYRPTRYAGDAPLRQRPTTRTCHRA
jgi:Protein of unknown function (DUF3606)